VARDLGIDMRSHWRPDGGFFAKRNREQLIGIAGDCGYADGNGSVASYNFWLLGNVDAWFHAGLPRQFRGFGARYIQHVNVDTT
jgi:hypothetical protein